MWLALSIYVEHAHDQHDWSGCKQRGFGQNLAAEIQRLAPQVELSSLYLAATVRLPARLEYSFFSSTAAASAPVDACLADQSSSLARFEQWRACV